MVRMRKYAKPCEEKFRTSKDEDHFPDMRRARMYSWKPSIAEVHEFGDPCFGSTTCSSYNSAEFK